MDSITNLQQSRLTFTVMDGAIPPKPTDDHEDPVVASSDETVGTAVATKTANVGEYELLVVSVAPAPDDPANPGTPTVERIVVTVDGIQGPGENILTGIYEFTVTRDPRTGAQSLQFSAATIEDKP